LLLWISTYLWNFHHDGLCLTSLVHSSEGAICDAYTYTVQI
jgi:hypothetical protein